MRPPPQRPTRILRIGPDDSLIDPPGGTAVAGLPTVSAVSPSSTGLLVAGRVSPADTLIAAPLALDSAPASGASTVIALGGNNESAPAAVSAGSGFLVTWGDTRTPEGGLMAARVDSMGATRDPNAIPIQLGESAQGSAASDGTDYLVSWATGSGVKTRRVTSAGETPSDAVVAFLSSPNVGLKSAVAFDGMSYRAYWTSLGTQPPGPSPTPYFIAEAGFGRSGDLLWTVPMGFGLPATDPAVACGGNDCLLAISRTTPGVPPFPSGAPIIRVTSLLRGGTADLPAASTAGQILPVVAFGGTNWLVVWRDGDGHSIWAARLERNMQLLDTVPLTIAENQTLVKLTASFDGTDYLIAWQSGGIRLARVTTQGVVLDVGGVAGPAGTSPALAGPLLAYSQMVGDAWRVLVRLRSTAGSPVDGGAPDTTEPSSDGGSADAGVEAAADVTPPPIDAGLDLTLDEARDTSAEPSVDGSAEPDSGKDVGTDTIAVDAAPVDAASAEVAPDATIDHGREGPPGRDLSGCDCSVTGRAPLSSWVVTLVLVMVARRRRTSRSTPPPPQ
jgi:MYXO-CTERM domain-containing protein